MVQKESGQKATRFTCVTQFFWSLKVKTKRRYIFFFLASVQVTFIGVHRQTRGSFGYIGLAFQTAIARLARHALRRGQSATAALLRPTATATATARQRAFRRRRKRGRRRDRGCSGRLAHRRLGLIPGETRSATGPERQRVIIHLIGDYLLHVLDLVHHVAVLHLAATHLIRLAVHGGGLERALAALVAFLAFLAHLALHVALVVLLIARDFVRDPLLLFFGLFADFFDAARVIVFAAWHPRVLSQIDHVQDHEANASRHAILYFLFFLFKHIFIANYKKKKKTAKKCHAWHRLNGNQRVKS